MATPIDGPSIYKQLRDKAEAKLQTGTTPTGGQWSMGIDALRLLHRLSSSPGKAEDALKLLHELQVHQVEIDLQHEEIVANEHVLAEDLALYQALYECAPFAYCVVDLAGSVISGNHAAGKLFGVDREHLAGQQIETFLSPQSRLQLLDLLTHVAQRSVRDSCIVEMGGEAPSSTHLQLYATPGPVHEQCLLVCYELGNAQ